MSCRHKYNLPHPDDVCLDCDVLEPEPCIEHHPALIQCIIGHWNHYRFEHCRQCGRGLNVKKSLRVALEQVDALIDVVKRLHDLADNMNVELCAPGIYCKGCYSHLYDSMEGVVHAKDCVIKQARIQMRIAACP